MEPTTDQPSEPTDSEVVNLDGPKLKILAHPLRSRLLSELRTAGPATSTILADRLSTNSGATSYHLRRLADVGLIEEAVEKQKVGRQRWWQAAHRYTSWTESDFDDDPDERAAVDWLLGSYLRTTNGWLEDWNASRRTWPIEWRRAAEDSDYQLYTDPAGLEALTAELHEVIERHVEASRRPAPTGDPDRRRVTVVVHAFPQPDVQP